MEQKKSGNGMKNKWRCFKGKLEEEKTKNRFILVFTKRNDVFYSSEASITINVFYGMDSTRERFFINSVNKRQVCVVVRV